MSHPVTRWGIYLRISRTDDRRGVERQLEECQYRLSMMPAADEDDIELYDENNTSATKGIEHRPEYRRMIADAKAGLIGGVMVFVQDRGWRDFDEVRAFAKAGIRFATSTAGEQDLSDPMTRHAFFQAGLSAEHEVEMIAWRVAKAARQRAQRGQAHGRAPFGWRREVELRSGRVVDSWDVIDEAEAGLIRHAAGELLRGISLRAIVAELNAGEVKPRPFVYRKGRYQGRTAVQLWNSHRLRDVLLREANAAIRVHKGEAVSAAVWPAILDQQTYSRVRTLLADPSRRSSDKGSAPRWLLSGIATCSVCPGGSRVNVTSNRGTRPIYNCVGCWQRHYVEDVDRYVGDLIEARLADPAYAEVAPEAQAELDSLYAQIDAQRAEQGTYAGLKRAGKITLGQMLELNADTDAVVAELEERISALRPQLSAGVDLPDGWAGADLLTKRALIRDQFAELALVPSRFRGNVRTFDTIAEEVRHTFR